MFDRSNSVQRKCETETKKPPIKQVNTPSKRNYCRNSSPIARNLEKTFTQSLNDQNQTDLTSSIKKKVKLTSHLLSTNKFLFGDSYSSIENIDINRTKYNSLLNLNIDDKESAYNFFRQKKIPKTSYKVLDSPNLKDDFYLHLLDWSKKDDVAVGLDKQLYVWEGKTSRVRLIHTLIDSDYLTAVKWTNDGEKVIVGTNYGMISIWDINKTKEIKTFKCDKKRVDVISTMNTSDNVYSVGLVNKMIISYDVRVGWARPVSQYKGHTQEICGLKWSLDDRRLASGGNDNKLIIWNNRMAKMERIFSSHSSAVKAIDWSPHKFGYLISGGGTQDKTLKLWNINTMSLVDSIETYSQVCNVAFSKISHEFVTTHGYTNNCILIWDSQKMEVKASLKGHKDRVIYMALGPDSKNIVTGAGDETIRFWNVFTEDPQSNEDLSLLSKNKKLR